MNYKDNLRYEFVVHPRQHFVGLIWDEATSTSLTLVHRYAIGVGEEGHCTIEYWQNQGIPYQTEFIQKGIYKMSVRVKKDHITIFIYKRRLDFTRYLFPYFNWALQQRIHLPNLFI